MPDSSAFFDTSALVPLIVAQPSGQEARKAYRKFARQVVAWTTPIEAAGAMYRSVRLGALSEANARRALGRLSQLEKRWTEILATESVRALSINLLANYSLRRLTPFNLHQRWCGAITSLVTAHLCALIEGLVKLRRQPASQSSRTA